MTFYLMSAFVLFLTGCKMFESDSARVRANQSYRQDSTTKAAPTQEGGMVVMVMDDGFDSTHEVFRDKVLAEYTIVCEEESLSLTEGASDAVSIVPEDEDEDEPLSEEEEETTELTDEEYKKKVLKAYRNPEGSCRIEEKISFRGSKNLKDIEKYRDKWNTAIRKKSSLDLSESVQDKIFSTISGDLDKTSYHGTNVASLIAYDNPDVRLVLVQLELESGEPQSDCFRQKDLDQYLRIHKDEEVRKAYIEAPLEPAEAKLIEIAKKYNVRIVNQSYGSLSREAIAAQHKELGCPAYDFGTHFAEQGKLDKAKLQYRIKNMPEATPEILTVTSAGNDGSRIDLPEDAEKCSESDEFRVIVGALDYENNIAEFSNYGKCVDYYIQGAQVVVAAPNGFLSVTDGTSFSSPLLVRHLSKNFNSGATPQEMLRFLKSSADNNRFLPRTAFPKELAFESSRTIGAFALTGPGSKKKAPGRPNHLRLPPWLRR